MSTDQIEKHRNKLVADFIKGDDSFKDIKAHAFLAGFSAGQAAGYLMGYIAGLSKVRFAEPQLAAAKAELAKILEGK